MDDLTNTQSEEYNSDQLKDKTSPTFGKANFKTFALLRQQESRLSQFESNLQKTLELLNNKSPTAEASIDAQSRSITYQTQSVQEQQIPSMSRLNLSHHSVNEKDMNSTSAAPVVDIERKSIVSDVNNNSIVNKQDDEIKLEKYYQISANTLERENIDLKDKLFKVEKENEQLNEDVETLRMKKEVDNPQDQYNTQQTDSSNSYREENEELKRTIADLNQEHDFLRAEIIKVKTDAFKKYEQLQKNNDELLQSYEERFKISQKNTTEKYENEVNDLSAELEKSRAYNKKLNEEMRDQRQKMGSTIMELEKEKHELLSKFSQMQFCQSHGEGSSSTEVVIEQLVREKSDLDNRYNDLFQSYTTLLEHNNTLVKKIESLESQSSVEQISKHDISSTSIHTHSHHPNDSIATGPRRDSLRNPEQFQHNHQSTHSTQPTSSSARNSNKQYQDKYQNHHSMAQLEEESQQQMASTNMDSQEIAPQYRLSGRVSTNQSQAKISTSQQIDREQLRESQERSFMSEFQQNNQNFLNNTEASVSGRIRKNSVTGREAQNQSKTNASFQSISYDDEKTFQSHMRMSDLHGENNSRTNSILKPKHSKQQMNLEDLRPELTSFEIQEKPKQIKSATNKNARGATNNFSNVQSRYMQQQPKKATAQSPKMKEMQKAIKEVNRKQDHKKDRISRIASGSKENKENMRVVDNRMNKMAPGGIRESSAHQLQRRNSKTSIQTSAKKLSTSQSKQKMMTSYEKPMKQSHYREGSLGRSQNSIGHMEPERESFARSEREETCFQNSRLKNLKKISSKSDLRPMSPEHPGTSTSNPGSHLKKSMNSNRSAKKPSKIPVYSRVSSSKKH